MAALLAAGFGAMSLTGPVVPGLGSTVGACSATTAGISPDRAAVWVIVLVPILVSVTALKQGILHTSQADPSTNR